MHGIEGIRHQGVIERRVEQEALAGSQFKAGPHVVRIGLQPIFHFVMDELRIVLTQMAAALADLVENVVDGRGAARFLVDEDAFRGKLVAEQFFQRTPQEAVIGHVGGIVRRGDDLRLLLILSETVQIEGQFSDQDHGKHRIIRRGDQLSLAQITGHEDRDRGKDHAAEIRGLQEGSCLSEMIADVPAVLRCVMLIEDADQRIGLLHLHLFRDEERQDHPLQHDERQHDGRVEQDHGDIDAVLGNDLAYLIAQRSQPEARKHFHELVA